MEVLLVTNSTPENKMDFVGLPICGTVRNLRQMWIAYSLNQGSYRPWKVLEFYCSEFQAWKVLEKGIGPGKPWKFLDSPGILKQSFWIF